MFDSEKYYQLGEIVKTHGVKGEISLKIDLNVSDDELKNLESVFILIEGIPIPFFIEYLKLQNNRFIVKFDNYSSLEKVEEFVNCIILIDKSKIKIDDSSIQFTDLIGFKAIDDDIEIGIITDFIEYSTNMIFSINNKGKELLIPANADFIIDVDIDNKVVYFNLPKGLEFL